MGSPSSFFNWTTQHLKAISTGVAFFFLCILVGLSTTMAAPPTVQEDVHIEAHVISSITPEEVSGLSGVYIGNNTIQVTWTPPATLPSSYTVSYRIVGLESSFHSAISLAAGSSSFLLTNTLSNQTYEFLVQTVYGSNTSAGSNATASTPLQSTQTGSTTGGGGPSSALSVPAITAPTITDISGTGLTQIHLTWIPPSDSTYPIGIYEIYKSIGTEPFPISPTFTTPANELTYTDSAVIENTKYRYMIRAKDIYGNSSGNSNIMDMLLVQTAPSSRVLPLTSATRDSAFYISIQSYDINDVSSIELYASKNGGAYEYVMTIDPQTQERVLFDSSIFGGDGVYSFYTRATNTLGIKEDIPGTPDMTILVDATPPNPPVLQDQSTIQGDILRSIINIISPSGDNVEMYIGSTGVDEADSSIPLRTWIPFQHEFTLTFIDNQPRMIAVTLRDTLGNISSTVFLQISPDGSITQAPIETQDNFDLVFESAPELGNNIFTETNNDTPLPPNGDADSDGISNDDETHIWGTDPLSSNSYPKNITEVRSSLTPGSQIASGSALDIYGNGPSEWTIELFLKGDKWSKIGSTQIGRNGKYFMSLTFPDSYLSSAPLLYVISDPSGEHTYYYRGGEVSFLPESFFYTILFKQIGSVTLSDIDFLPLLRIQDTTLRKMELLKNALFKSNQLIGRKGTDHILTNLFLSPEARKQLQFPLTLTLLWKSDTEESMSSIEILNRDTTTALPLPERIQDGNYSVRVFLTDAQKRMGFSRTFSFQLTQNPTIPLYPSSPTLMCPEYSLPFSFWLWIVLAFLCGILLAFIGDRLRKKKVEEKTIIQKSK